MKALATLTACLVLGAATPSLAHIAMAGPRAAGIHIMRPPGDHGNGLGDHGNGLGDHGRGKGRYRGGGTGLDASGDVVFGNPAPDTPPDLTPPPPFGPVGPIIQLPPSMPCPAVEPAVARSSGPHIIYINQKPTLPANAPKVIYGTQ